MARQDARRRRGSSLTGAPARATIRERPSVTIMADEPSVITLLTDFGGFEPYVGVMKGVILGIAPRAVLVDLTHEIPPHDVAAGAYHLANAWSWFPPGTIHLAVVDPGVGGSRRALAVAAGGHAFVAPDNGLLGPILGRLPHRAFAIDVSRARGMTTAPTFHGRDVFAPAAARLARGADPSDLGPPVEDPVLPLASARRRGPSRKEDPAGAVRRVRVVHVDRFGNLILDVAAADLGLPEPGIVSSDVHSWSARIAGRTVDRFVTHYDAAAGGLCLLVNSDGLLEIAQPGGSAAAELRAGRGTLVTLTKRGSAE